MSDKALMRCKPMLPFRSADGSNIFHQPEAHLLPMERKCDIDEVVLKSKRYWDDNPHGNKDPTPWDYLHLAGTLLQDCSVDIGNCKLTKLECDNLLDLYERVIAEKYTPEKERQLAIRARPAEKLSSQLKDFAGEAHKLGYGLGDDITVVTKCTFLYYAFLRLAKECRDADKDGNPINHEDSLRAYSDLLGQANNNDWIRVGIVMVRERRINDGLCDKWIPTNTVYWQTL